MTGYCGWHMSSSSDASTCLRCSLLTQHLIFPPQIHSTLQALQAPCRPNLKILRSPALLLPDRERNSIGSRDMMWARCWRYLTPEMTWLNSHTVVATTTAVLLAMPSTPSISIALHS
ncbi:hypothetical protein M8C21_009590 [Ambrosia artemisiifolia]|uniref:Uncharacterized protein n=1 Tax=Ambrosia artemisiifolia TaxID=4212 RepID=A0AAD5GT17_AMBAR|nr:hypothetical protein M8C21_009590 [Ambrosia artemisiifolia]